MGAVPGTAPYWSESMVDEGGRPSTITISEIAQWQKLVSRMSIPGRVQRNKC